MIACILSISANLKISTLELIHEWFFGINLQEIIHVISLQLLVSVISGLALGDKPSPKNARKILYYFYRQSQILSVIRDDIEKERFESCVCR